MTVEDLKQLVALFKKAIKEQTGKDFPISGYVEMRYDEEQKRVIYQPVTIEPREITVAARNGIIGYGCGGLQAA